MYPICKWGYDELCSRLDKLIEQELYNEAVIASAQTIEQVFKRVIQQWMTKQRKGLNKKFELIDINSKSERDETIRRIASLDKIKNAWKKLIALNNKELHLVKVVNSIAGENSWSILTSSKKVKVKISKLSYECRYGLFHLRHRLVHGVHSPPREDIKILATWGVNFIKALLDPQNGLVRILGWNPQKRISPFYDSDNYTESEKNKARDLEALYEKLHECGKQVYSSCNGCLFPMDLYSLSAIDRSLHNLAGFQVLLENDNYLCAIPILRMQLDTLMRYWAFLLVEDAHKFANDILTGTPVNKIKDKDNAKLTDAYIVGKLEIKDPWIKRVYKFGCNFVHFSDAHIKSVIFNSPQIGDEKFRDLHLTIKDKNVPQKDITEAIDAFKVITEGLIDTIQLWSSKVRKLYNEEELKNEFPNVA